MKRFLLLIVLFPLFTWSAYTQHFSLGIKGGITRYSLNPAQSIPSYGLASAGATNYGLLVQYKFNNTFGVQVEPSYINKNFKLSKENWYSSAGFNFFAFPILGKVYLGKRFSFNVGPEVTFLSNAGPDKDYFLFKNKLNIGLDAGASFIIGKRFYLGARYNMDLLPECKGIIYSDKAGSDVFLTDFKFKGWVFDLGFLIIK
jgi:hypothetical protein